MPHKFSPHNIERLLRIDRLGSLSPEEFLKSCGLKKGMTFADIGCGPGFFTLPASLIVGSKNKVYAIDTQKEMLEELKKRITDPLDPRSGNPSERMGLVPQRVPRNIIPIESGENAIPLDSSIIDLALCAYVLHEVETKRAFLKEVYRILKPGAMLIIVDWKKKKEDNGPPFFERISLKFALKLLWDAGFIGLESSFPNLSHYRINAAKSPVLSL